jgi:hypothetical protein
MPVIGFAAVGNPAPSPVEDELRSPYIVSYKPTDFDGRFRSIGKQSRDDL